MRRLFLGTEMPYRVVITEVTDFGASLHCVAGWDLDAGRMVRPEPGPAAFWQKAYVGPGSVFWPSHEVSFEADRPNPPTEFPHLTEDLVVRLNTLNRVRVMPAAEFSQLALQISAPSVGAAYGGALQVGAKPYVVPGTQCPSLGGVTLPIQSVNFYTDQYRDKPPKLRAMVVDGLATYDLSITSSELRALHRAGGLAAVRAQFANATRIHLRVGLAREFPQGRCHAQINGAFPIL